MGGPVLAFRGTGIVAGKNRLVAGRSGCAEKDIRDVDAVRNIARRQFSTGQIAEGGQQIDSGDETLIIHRARLDLTGPADEKRNIDAAFVEGTFVAFPTAGGSF